MKKYLITYETKQRGFSPIRKTATEYGDNKTEVRKYFKMMFKGAKIISIDKV